MRLTLVNQAGRTDPLTGVRTDVAQRVDILADTDCDGTGRALPRLDLPAGDASSSPGGTGHVLRLVGLKVGMLLGGSVPIVFTFRNAGSITLPTPVDTGAAAGPASPPCRPAPEHCAVPPEARPQHPSPGRRGPCPAPFPARRGRGGGGPALDVLWRDGAGGIMRP